MLEFAVLLAVLVSIVTATVIFIESWPLGVVAIVGGFVCIAWGIGFLVRLRHRNVITQAAVADGLRILVFTGNPGFVHPPDLPWWRTWASYVVEATHRGGGARRYYVFLTGVLFCTFALTVSFSTDEDYLWFDADGKPVSPEDRPND